MVVIARKDIIFGLGIKSLCYTFKNWVIMGNYMGMTKANFILSFYIYMEIYT